MDALNKRFAFLVLGLALGGAAQAAPFQNGSFETGPSAGSFLSLPAGDTQITGWTVTGAGIDYIGSYWVSADGSHSLDLSAGAAGGVEQSFDTTAGRRYRVSFAMAGNPACAPAVKTMQVQASGGAAASYTFDTTGHDLANMGWATQTYTFTATGSTSTLSFTSLTDTACGPALDNVVVSDMTPAPVPTLSQWGLIALAGLLGALAWRGRRA